MKKKENTHTHTPELCGEWLSLNHCWLMNLLNVIWQNEKCLKTLIYSLCHAYIYRFSWILLFTSLQFLRKKKKTTKFLQCGLDKSYIFLCSACRFLFWSIPIFFFHFACTNSCNSVGIIFKKPKINPKLCIEHSKLWLEIQPFKCFNKLRYRGCCYYCCCWFFFYLVSCVLHRFDQVAKIPLDFAASV